MKFHVYKRPRQPALASVMVAGTFHSRVPMDTLIRKAAWDYQQRARVAAVHPGPRHPYPAAH